MARHIIFVATFDKDSIEISDKLPVVRPLNRPDLPYPVTQGYSLVRLRVDSDSPPALPGRDLTAAEYGEWRSSLAASSALEEPVEPRIVLLGLGGLCVAVRTFGVESIPYGTLLEVRVENIGPYPIGKVEVIWHGRWEASGYGEPIGRGFHLESVGEPPRQLAPGASRTFAMRKPRLQQCLSYAASLPPDQYYLGVNASLPGQEATYEIHTVPGANLSAVIEVLEHYLDTEGEQN